MVVARGFRLPTGYAGSFLSDDEYDFKVHRKQQNSVPIQRYFEYKESSEHQDDVEEVLLFSGGLDLTRRRGKGSSMRSAAARCTGQPSIKP